MDANNKLVPDVDITVKEYNTKYCRECNTAASFVNCLEDAMQGSGAYEEAMHQLKCIGWPECRETLSTAIEIYRQVMLGKVIGGPVSSNFRHVVLCEDCKHYACREVNGKKFLGRCHKFGIVNRNEDFCSYGEKKEG